VVILAIVLTEVLGCGESKKGRLEEEMALVIKAGKKQLTLAEKKNLKKQNHPILMQIGDPNTQKLLSLFANLPQDAHNELLEKGYLKWKFAELDRERQQVYQEFVQFNIETAKQQGVAPNPAFSLQALQKADVGFAVIEIPETKQKVISWFILWPVGQPIWITVVGAKACGTQPYFTAHLNQLPLLRGMPESKLP
jgi:hypothetical protein